MFLWFIILFSINSVMHPVHSSVTNISYNPKGKHFDITIRLYKDDFQNIILKKYNYQLYLENNTLSDSANFYISDYIKHHLIFIVKKKGYNSYMFTGWKTNFEAIWLDFKLPFNKKPETLTLHNSLLNDLFNDQKNMVIFSFSKKEQGLIFSKNQENKSISL